MAGTDASNEDNRFSDSRKRKHQDVEEQSQAKETIEDEEEEDEEEEEDKTPCDHNLGTFCDRGPQYFCETYLAKNKRFPRKCSGCGKDPSKWKKPIEAKMCLNAEKSNHVCDLCYCRECFGRKVVEAEEKNGATRSSGRSRRMTAKVAATNAGR